MTKKTTRTTSMGTTLTENQWTHYWANIVSHCPGGMTKSYQRALDLLLSNLTQKQIKTFLGNPGIKIFTTFELRIQTSFLIQGASGMYYILYGSGGYKGNVMRVHIHKKALFYIHGFCANSTLALMPDVLLGAKTLLESETGEYYWWSRAIPKQSQVCYKCENMNTATGFRDRQVHWTKQDSQDILKGGHLW